MDFLERQKTPREPALKDSCWTKLPHVWFGSCMRMLGPHDVVDVSISKTVALQTKKQKLSRYTPWRRLGGEEV
jgi:hypothetical protein